MQRLLSALPVISVVTILGIGQGLLSMTPPEFSAARFFFILAVTVVSARISWWTWAKFSGRKRALAMIACVLLAMLLFGGLAMWVSRRERLWAQAQVPAPLQARNPNPGLHQASNAPPLRLAPTVTASVQPPPAISVNASSSQAKRHVAVSKTSAEAAKVESGISISGTNQGIVTQNQSGGSNTVNLGLPKRDLSPQVRSEMVRLLQPNAGTCIGFASTQGDVEASGFKTVLMEVFGDSGWKTEDRQTFMFFGEQKGLVITIAASVAEDGPVRTAWSALAKTGNPIQGNRGDMAGPCGIYVQVWHAP